jgi:urease accessory protein
MDLATLMRLLQLSSPSLPIGAYSYSQGLEAALESGIADSPEAVERWIGDHLTLVLGRADAPYWWRLVRAFSAGDTETAARWNAEFVASRDGAELRAETVQMGYSLTRLLAELDGAEAVAPLQTLEPVSLPAAFTFAVVRWQLPPPEALGAYLWSWLEAQVLAYLKTGRVGQMHGQRLLAGIARQVPAVVAASAQFGDDDLSSAAPGLALASYGHEVQDGRLFRS